MSVFERANAELAARVIAELAQLDPGQLRAAANALEALRRAQLYMGRENHSMCSNFNALVSWTWGASATGYKDLEVEVSRLVNTGMPALLAQAMQNLEDQAATACATLVRA